MTSSGLKPIEQFRPGDWVLSASEFDPEAPPEPRRVEEVFTNVMPLLHLQVGGQIIRTTTEHPFYVRGKGWVAAKDLQNGDILRSHDGQWVSVESVAEGEGLAAVYNLRVADYHTYFVGSIEWGFSVWAHNAYDPTSTRSIQKQLEGTGQLAALRRNPNLKGIDIDALLKRSPAQLEQMVNDGTLPSKVLKQIKKAFEGRDLRHGM